MTKIEQVARAIAGVFQTENKGQSEFSKQEAARLFLPAARAAIAAMKIDGHENYYSNMSFNDRLDEALDELVAHFGEKQ